MTPPGHRPAEVASDLGVSARTLRRWTSQFHEFLSADMSGREDVNGATRRYQDRDLVLLAQVRDFLASGLTYDEVRRQLAGGVAAGALTSQEREPGRPTFGAVIEPDLPELAPSGGELAVPEGARMLADALLTLSDGQKIILSGQQTERQLLGVLLQDNFNLKDENRRLRDRMVETERKLFEMKREVDAGQVQERERMRQMEAQMFELQRRLDRIAEQQAGLYAPAPASIVTPPPPPVAAPVPRLSPAPSPAPLEPPLAPDSPPTGLTRPAASIPPKRRGLWDWLLGR